MPRFFSAFQAKLEELHISELNYELGKFAQESKSYVTNNLRPGRFWKSRTASGSDSVEKGLPKSTSLPSFPASNNNTRTRQQNKYKYRSSLIEHPEELAAIEEQELSEVGNARDSSKAVEHFIKVIESRPSGDKTRPRARLNTREDIRKKLAAFQPEGLSKPDPGKGATPRKVDDLEVCFINEIVDEPDSLLKEASRVEPQRSLLKKSRSDYVFGNTAHLPLTPLADNNLGSFPEHTTVEEIQNQAALDLAKCQDLARRKLVLDKRRRRAAEDEAFKSLIGKDLCGRLSQEQLEKLNIPTLQVK